MTMRTSQKVSRKLDEDRLAREVSPLHLTPRPNAATSLLLADIILRGASSQFRKKLERRIPSAGSPNEEHQQGPLDGQTLLKSLALYGASKLANRPPWGLGLVAGGLGLKTLYDRGKARRRRLSAQTDAQEDA